MSTVNNTGPIDEGDLDSVEAASTDDYISELVQDEEKEDGERDMAGMEIDDPSREDPVDDDDISPKEEEKLEDEGYGKGAPTVAIDDLIDEELKTEENNYDD